MPKVMPAHSAWPWAAAAAAAAKAKAAAAAAAADSMMSEDMTTVAVLIMALRAKFKTLHDDVVKAGPVRLCVMRSATLYGHSTWRLRSCAERCRFVRHSVWALHLGNILKSAYWPYSTGLELMKRSKGASGGPDPNELIALSSWFDGRLAAGAYTRPSFSATLSAFCGTRGVQGAFRGYIWRGWRRF